MANEKHVEILKQGVEVWNNWRAQDINMRPDLTGANLSKERLIRVDFSRANLRQADLSNADLSAADCTGADFSRATLNRAVLSEANLLSADLSETNLNRAILAAVNFVAGTLVKADLSGASLALANLTMVNFTDTNLSDAEIGLTTFGYNDLSTVVGLNSVKHRMPSIIGIDTIYRSKGNIPWVFLRGAGVPDDFIAYVRSLAGKVIEFYSCFISYSSKDQDFLERLYPDLQRKGIRCWYASEDLKIGDPFRSRIDESIRLHDKLLLILSENSIESPWVEDEVEAALEKEHQQNKLVLLPIRLDDAVMKTDKAWAAKIRRTRYVGDFRDWKNHDRYQSAFARLLRDLKAEDVKSGEKH